MAADHEAMELTRQSFLARRKHGLQVRRPFALSEEEPEPWEFLPWAVQRRLLHEPLTDLSPLSPDEAAEARQKLAIYRSLYEP
jgi:hypothetical protein